MKIPVAGTAIKMLAITRFCRILGTMLVNGVPLLQALRISKDATGSSLMAERIAEATESHPANATATPQYNTINAGGNQVVSVLAVALGTRRAHGLATVATRLAQDPVGLGIGRPHHSPAGGVAALDAPAQPNGPSAVIR